MQGEAIKLSVISLAMTCQLESIQYTHAARW